MDLIIIFVVGLLLSLVFHPLAIKAARVLDIVDDPNRDKVHKTPTPVLGGIAICGSILVAMIIARMSGIFVWDRPFDGLLVGGGLIALVGLIDDRFGMNPTIKLIGQFIASGLFVIFAEPHIGVFHPLIEFGALIFGIMVMMNAFNILDNMDGVTGVMSFAAGLSFLAVARISGDHNLAVLLAAATGAIIGFLKFNLPRARIFMGDAGALFLGFLFGAVAILYLMKNRSYYLMTTPFLILSYPIFDIALVSLSRMREKRSLAVAAPDSSPYRLVRWVFTTKNAFLMVMAINLAMGAAGVTAYMLKGDQVSVLMIFIAGLSLAVFGVHLYRNFLYFVERTVFFLVDMLAINLALYFLYNLKYTWGLLSFEVYIPYSEMFAPAIWISLFWVLLFSVMGIYEIRPNRRFADYLLALAKIISLGIAGFLIVLYLLEGQIVISPLPLVCYVGVLAIFNIIFKFTAFSVARWLAKKSFKKPRAALFIRDEQPELDQLLSLAADRFQIIGYFGEQKLSEQYKKITYLGGESTLGMNIMQRHIEKIILVWPKSCYEDYSRILQAHYFLENEYLVAGQPADPFNGFKFFKLDRPGFVKISLELLRTWEWMAKRGIDLLMSTIILIVSGPIFLIEWIQAKLRKTPVFEKIRFYGRDGQVRSFLNFYGRSRSPDPRGAIRPGLPALLSVVAGNLTLVGTFPLTPERAAIDSQKMPGFWRRRLIKPGLTGPAHFGPTEEYFARELYYMQHMSLLFDFYWMLAGALKTMRILPR